METIYLTEAMRGRRRPVSVDAIIDMDAWPATPQDYGLNKLSIEDEEFGQNLFGASDNYDLTEISLDDGESFFVLHPINEINQAINDGVEDLHMCPALRRRLGNELDRLCVRTQAIHVMKGFGTVDMGDADPSSELETIERMPIDIWTDFHNGLLIDGACPADLLRQLFRSEQARSLKPEIIQ